MKMKQFLLNISIVLFISGIFLSTKAGQNIQLTLENAVDIAMDNSYRIKNLEMEIDKTLLRLKARRAGLKSKVFMDIQTPDISRISENKWNSTLYRDEIVRQNTQRWQSDLSIKQPVIFFGYPTNGYVSLNYKVYRYQQKDDGDRGIDYYNRFYFKYEQPLFTPNNLKNDLERAELDLRDSQLDFIADKVDIIRDIGYDYYELFELAYEKIIFSNQLDILDHIMNIAESLIAQDSTHSSDEIQIQLEITNEKEFLLDNRSNMRRETSNMKQRLRLNADDSLFIVPKIKITPVYIKLEEAIDLGLKNNPWLRSLYLSKREAELDVERVKGENSFHVNLEFTYGLEKKESSFKSIWDEYDNSNSATINAYIPLWDWGERRALIQSEQIDVNRRELQIEEQKDNIKKNIINSYTNLKEYEERCLNLDNSRKISGEFVQISIDKYSAGELSLQSLLQIVERHKSTERNFLETYMGYRRSLLNLMVNTHYDYEKSISLVDEQFNDKF
ncbi:TolC family protein [candidate division KSB1 bacterium]|nr:TolC family protein [candidate division KSB1 bacterium]